MFDMESEEEYLEMHRRRTSVRELCQKRDSLPEFDPLRPILQAVISQAENLSVEDLYLFRAELGLYEIELAQQEQAQGTAIEALKENKAVREAVRKQTEAEYTHLKALGLSPRRKEGGRWIESDEDGELDD